MKTLDEQVASLKRELALRVRIYPKWIAKGTMSQHKAEHEIDCVRDAITSLETFRNIGARDVYEAQMDLAIEKAKKEAGLL